MRAWSFIGCKGGLAGKPPFCPNPARSERPRGDTPLRRGIADRRAYVIDRLVCVEEHLPVTRVVAVWARRQYRPHVVELEDRNNLDRKLDSPAAPLC
jgi:hypothetical protein